MNALQLLADATTTQPAPMEWWQNPQSLFFALIFGVLIIMIFSSSKTKRNDQKKRDDMLANMKKGARVMTIGGILGTIVDVRDNEVVLKVDESSNTKIKFTRDAIKSVVADEESPK